MISKVRSNDLELAKSEGKKSHLYVVLRKIMVALNRYLHFLSGYAKNMRITS